MPELIYVKDDGPKLYVCPRGHVTRMVAGERIVCRKRVKVFGRCDYTAIRIIFPAEGGPLRA